MGVLLKQGVCGDLHREMRRAVGKLEAFYRLRGKDLIITSIREGTHSASSLHYDGRAVDIRPQGATEREVQELLGSDYDVVDEGDHIHVEFDPV